jgi:hypothetical protein
MTNNVFTVRNMFYPHKDYNSFLDDKLTMFKLCNYEIVLAKIWCNFWACFGLFCCLWSLFCCWWIFVELLGLWVLFYYLCLIFLFLISIGMSGHFGAGHLWARLGTSMLVHYRHVWRLLTIMIHLLQVCWLALNR